MSASDLRNDVDFYHTPPRRMSAAERRAFYGEQPEGEGVEGTIYILHFDAPISDGHTTQHYVGWAADLDARISAHAAGRGARLTQVAKERGIGFEVVASFPGTRADERRIKQQKHTKRLCPFCRAERLERDRKLAAERRRAQKEEKH